MTDRKAERERLQAEALKANLRRRKAQARGQKAAAETPPKSELAESAPPEPAPDGEPAP